MKTTKLENGKTQQEITGSIFEINFKEENATYGVGDKKFYGYKKADGNTIYLTVGNEEIWLNLNENGTLKKEYKTFKYFDKDFDYKIIKTTWK